MDRPPPRDYPGLSGRNCHQRQLQTESSAREVRVAVRSARHVLESNRVSLVRPMLRECMREELCMNVHQLDKKYFGRQGEPEDVIVGKSVDRYLTDARGRKYIDFMMGWCVGNLGWGNTEIR